MQRVYLRPYLHFGLKAERVDPLPQPPVAERPYGLWLRDLVRVFGEDVVAEWQDPPEGFGFEAWAEREAVSGPTRAGRACS